jgi:5'-3' exonuclease
LTWWKNAYPDQLHVLDNPYENDIFLNKFKTTFVSNVQKIVNHLNILHPIILVGKDCKREQIWRNKLFPTYKANRVEDDGFMGGPFFKMAYDQKLFIQGGAKMILKHPHLEADDCIAIAVKNLLVKYPTSNIYIITSDKDYLQLAESRVRLFNLAFKDLTQQKSCTGNAECDLFCKILMGDVSDNIPSVFPKCGPKTALKYFKDRDLFDKKLQETDTYKHAFELNKQIIDFNNIPEKLVKEFMNAYFS